MVNVSVTPFTYDEPFDDTTGVLSKDRVRIKFAVHIIFKIKSSSEEIQEFAPEQVHHAHGKRAGRPQRDRRDGL